MKNGEGRFRSGLLPKAALLGFALGSAVVPRESHGYYYGLLGWGLLSTTTTAAAGAIAFGIYLTVQASSDDADVSEAAPARSLIDLSMLAAHSDLNMQVDLLVESPSAFAQFSNEMEQGSGPAVDAMVAATWLPAERLQQAWNKASSSVDPVSEPRGARAMVEAFLGDIAPELAVPDEIAAEMAWQLVLERAAAGGTQGGQAHGALAEWLGVPDEAVASASGVAMEQLGMDGSDSSRLSLHQDPDAFLDALAQAIEVEHREAIDARIAQIVQSSGLSASASRNNAG